MAIKNFEDKSLRIGKRVTKNNKNAIIEIKEKHCYPQFGLTVEAKNKEEADKKIKNIIN